MCVKEEHRIGNALQSLVDNYVDPSVNGRVLKTCQRAIREMGKLGKKKSFCFHK
jgi:hypothetical protein